MFAGRMTPLIKRYCSLIGRRETEYVADWHLTALLLICRRPPAARRRSWLACGHWNTVIERHTYCTSSLNHCIGWQTMLFTCLV